jgi:hypothetical protein
VFTDLLNIERKRVNISIPKVPTQHGSLHMINAIATPFDEKQITEKEYLSREKVVDNNTFIKVNHS